MCQLAMRANAVNFSHSIVSVRTQNRLVVVKRAHIMAAHQSLGDEYDVPNHFCDRPPKMCHEGKRSKRSATCFRYQSQQFGKCSPPNAANDNFIKIASTETIVFSMISGFSWLAKVFCRDANEAEHRPLPSTWTN